MRFLRAILLLCLLSIVAWTTIHSVAAQAPTWFKQESGVFTKLMGVHFVDPQNGYIAGSTGTVFATTNGGATWEKVALPVRESKETLRDVWTFNVRQQLVLGEYNRDLHPSSDMIFGPNFMLWRGDEMKEDWREISVAEPRNPRSLKPRRKAPGVDSRSDNEEDDEEFFRISSSMVVRMHFADERNGWLVGESGMIQRTSIGGMGWTMQYAVTRKLLNDVYAVSDKEVWIVGGGGTILRTTDGGQSWVEQNSPTTQNLRAVHFANAENGWAVGPNGLLLKATASQRRPDGTLPVKWDILPAPTKENLNDVFFISPQEGWVAGEHATILHTTDGGRTWADALEDTEVRRYINFNRLFFLNRTLGWAVGTSGAIYKFAPHAPALKPKV
ncbi:MAG: hypothetical protein HOP19_27265 [Acidobacteria bacterium]|nr:hypothetical protein [Acidobacteriota bacterium]